MNKPLPPGFPGFEASTELDPLALARIQQNDFGLIERFGKRFGGKCRYVARLGWVSYDNTHWTQNRDVAERAMVETISQIREEAQALTKAGEEEVAKPLRSFAAKGAPRAARVFQCLRLAQSYLTAEPDAFDRDQYALNVQNCTLRFKRDDNGKWHVRAAKHQDRDMITRVANASYDPDAEAPKWKAHLERMQPDPAQRGYLKRIMGYCALGIPNEQAFFVFQGRGGDGKSTTVNAVRHVLGTYADVADVSSFLMTKSQRSGDSATPALASLQGDTRLVATSEPPRGTELNDGLIKNITGGAPLKVRHLNNDPFTYSPRWKLVIECNGLPRISGADQGIWRRLHLLYWRVQLKREEMDPELEVKLREESSGILNWLVEGTLDYLDKGLAPPEQAKDDLANFRIGANIFGEWMECRLVLSERGVCPQKDLRMDYVAFCEEAGHEPMSFKAFTDELTSHQILRQTRLSTSGRNVLRGGARLRTADDDASGPEEAGEGQTPCGEDIPVFEG